MQGEQKTWHESLTWQEYKGLARIQGAQAWLS